MAERRRAVHNDMANVPVFQKMWLTTLEKVRVTAPFPATFVVQSGDCTVSQVDEMTAEIAASDEPGQTSILVTGLFPYAPTGHPPFVGIIQVDVVWPDMVLEVGSKERK